MRIARFFILHASQYVYIVPHPYCSVVEVGLYELSALVYLVKRQIRLHVAL